MPSRRSARFLLSLSAIAIVISLAIPRGVAGAQTAGPTTTTTMAPDASGLTISPAIVDNTLSAGSSFTAQLTLGNITATAVPIQLNKGRLESDQNIEGPEINKYDVSDWISTDVTSFLLNPQERKTVTATVNVPANAEPGGHYATIFFSALPTANDAEGQTLFNARVGVVFLVTVRGDLHASAKLKGPIETKSTQFDAGVSTFNFGLENTGNVHFQPTGNLVIKDVVGRTVKKIPLPQGVVLPGGSRNYSLSWERGIRPGYYTASIKIDAGVPLQAKSKRFLIAPIVILIPSALFIVIAGIIVVRYVLRRRRRAKRETIKDAIVAAEPGEREQEVHPKSSQSALESDADSSNEEQQ